MKWNTKGRIRIFVPEISFCSDREILQHEPDSNSLFRVCETECAGSETAD